MKETTITTQIQNNDIGEVKIVRDETEANKLLADGWLLMNAGTSHTDNAGYQAKIHFVLARKRGPTSRSTRPEKARAA